MFRVWVAKALDSQSSRNERFLVRLEKSLAASVFRDSRDNFLSQSSAGVCKDFKSESCLFAFRALAYHKLALLTAEIVLTELSF